MLNSSSNRSDSSQCEKSAAVSYFVLAALTQLQAGQDLALYGLDPRVPLVHTLGFKVPGLAGARHDEEVKVIFI